MNTATPITIDLRAPYARECCAMVLTMAAKGSQEEVESLFLDSLILEGLQEGVTPFLAMLDQQAAIRDALQAVADPVSESVSWPLPAAPDPDSAEFLRDMIRGRAQDLSGEQLGRLTAALEAVEAFDETMRSAELREEVVA